MRTAPSIRIAVACTLDVIQDFLCELGMKPRKYAAIQNHHIFSLLYHVIVRPTKIIKDPCKPGT
jgi:hypothetical protein